MKYKILAGFLCCLVLLSCLGTISVTAESNENAAIKAERFIDGIVAYQQNENIQDYDKHPYDLSGGEQ